MMNERKKLRKKNLQAFKDQNILMYQKLLDYQPLAELVFDESGKADVLFSNQYYYERRADAFTEEQLENFWAQPDRFALIAPLPENVDKHASEFLQNLLVAGIDEGIEYHSVQPTIESYSAVVFGIGLGLHLNEIAEKTNCRALFLVDVNLEFLFHSLEVFDWDCLYKRMEECNGSIRFIIQNSPVALASTLREAVRANNTTAVDGMIIYEHQSNSVLQAAKKRFKEDKQLISASLGFFYDESLMLANAHQNLNGGESVIFSRPGPTHRIDVPVFIVGSGPSLDEALPYIKENSDKAIIISAGTGIRPLLHAGIMPDFHLEQENLAVEICITELLKTYDLSSIIFLAATTIIPKATKDFDKTIFYVRESLSPHPLFSEDTSGCLTHPHNTVVNGAFSFAIDIGFRQLYLFGVDCGARDQTNHHSKQAYQFTDDAVIFAEQYFNIEVKGNFGGKFLMSQGLYESRDFISKAIGATPLGRRYYNCSDGALIEHTLPLLPKKVSLPEIDGGKESIVRQIYELMPVYSQEQFDRSWQEDILITEINHFADTFRELIEKIEDFSDYGYITHLLHFLIPETSGAPGKIEFTIKLLIRGSLIRSLTSFEFYNIRVKTADKNATFSELGRKYLIEEVEKIRTEAIELINDPDPERIYSD